MTLTLLMGMALAAAEPPEARWLSNYDEARAAAKESGKPIFAVFR